MPSLTRRSVDDSMTESDCNLVEVNHANHEKHGNTDVIVLARHPDLASDIEPDCLWEYLCKGFVSRTS